jgi:hypothetical protein
MRKILFIEEETMKPMRPKLADEVVVEFRHEAIRSAEVAERQGTPFVIVMNYQEDKHIVEVGRGRRHQMGCG